MLNKRVLIVIGFAFLCVSVAAEESEAPVEFGQIQREVANLPTVDSAITKARSIEQLLNIWVNSNRKLEQGLRNRVHNEASINSPINKISKHHVLVWFTKEESAVFIPHYLDQFFLDVKGEPKLTKSFIQRLVRDADTCSDGSIAFELPPDIYQDKEKFEVKVRFFALRCSDPDRFELALYEANRGGSYLKDSVSLNSYLPQYIRAFLLKDMADFFSGNSYSC